MSPDGISYRGQFSEGTKHGQGVETLQDGSSYEGPFTDDKRHGRGKIIMISKGKAIKPKPCDWYYGEQVVKKNRTYPNGDEYDGTMKGKARHGHGSFTYPNGDY